MSRRKHAPTRTPRAYPLEVTSDLWWKSAVIYCLDVETFLDTGGDGVGDFDGLIERIDYLAGLGVTCLWLMPFYPTENRDDGYDVTDYYAVDPRFGDFGDFVELLRTAKDRGIRVIADLVVNHTSSHHPWFRDARSSPDSDYRDFYVWCDEPPEDPAEPMFPGEQENVWTYDEEAGQYYRHRFFRNQPDLNQANPEVREEVREICGFWLQQGLAGFRVDAAPFLLEHGGEDRDATHRLLSELTSHIVRRRGDAVLLGEVNLPAEEAAEFCGYRGEELQMVFDFTLNQKLYLALARRDPRCLAAHLDDRPRLPRTCQWAHFVRNHDELTLDQLDEGERREVFEAFAPDEDMRLYGRGIRRRLPSMLDRDEARIRMVYSLLFALPGTPVLYYGEEIGMAENLEVDGRRAVRTPMQWTDDETGGFTEGAADAMVRPLPYGEVGPDRINVTQQLLDPESLLSWMQRLARRRRECPELGHGQYEVVDVGASEIFAHRCDWVGSTVIALHNFADAERRVRLEATVPEDTEELVLLFGDRDYEVSDAMELTLPPSGYCWLRIRRTGQRLLL